MASEHVCFKPRPPQGNDDALRCCTLHELGSRIGSPSPSWTCSLDSWARLASCVGGSIAHQLSSRVHLRKPFSSKTGIRRSLLLCPRESRTGSSQRRGWLFILWYVTGAHVVTVIAASYLAYAFPLSRTEIFLIAGLLTLGAFLVNYRGIVVSSRVQLAVIVAIVGLLITAVVASAPSIIPANFAPLFPNGYLPSELAPH